VRPTLVFEALSGLFTRDIQSGIEKTCALEAKGAPPPVPKCYALSVSVGNDLGVAPALGKSPTFAESAKMGHPSERHEAEITSREAVPLTARAPVSAAS
jgi:hypothetical protein